MTANLELESLATVVVAAAVVVVVAAVVVKQERVAIWCKSTWILGRSTLTRVIASTAA